MVVGAVLWGVIYSQGWLVSLVAFVTAYVGIIVYDKFYKVNRTVYIVSGVVICVLNIIASFLSIGITVAIEAEVSLKIAFEAVFEVIGDFVPDLIRDGLLCVAFTVLGLVGVKKTYEEKKLKKEMQENSMNAIADSANSTSEQNSDDSKTDPVVQAKLDEVNQKVQEIMNNTQSDNENTETSVEQKTESKETRPEQNIVSDDSDK